MRELEIKIKLEMLITEREGMIAENLIHKQNKDYFLYGEESFFALNKQMEDLLTLLKDID